MKKKIFYIYEVKGIKNGCTTQWDIRCGQNFEKYNIMPVIVETYEYPNTAEYWQIVGDREWELAELNGYPKGAHYRAAREKRILACKIAGNRSIESGRWSDVRVLGSKACRKLTFEDAQKIRELYANKKDNKTNQYKLAEMYHIDQSTIADIIHKKTYINQ